MREIDLKKKIFKMSGRTKIHIDEDTVFEKPIKVNGYEANNMNELHELLEGDVITFQKYEDIIALLEMGETGIKKQRKKYKELYEEERLRANGWLRDYQEICKAINEIEAITKDSKVLDIIAKLRRGA